MLKSLSVLPFLFIIAIALMPPAAHADKLSWTAPTTRANGVALDPATEIAAYKIYKDGVAAETVAAPATTYTSAASCQSFKWQVTAVDKTLPPVGPLESVLSISAASIVDPVGCAPKSPGGLTVSKSP